MTTQEMLLEDGSWVLLVHFIYQAPEGLFVGLGLPLTDSKEKRWRIACAPEMLEQNFPTQTGRNFPVQRTNDPRAVSCPNCKQTQMYQDELARQPVLYRAK
jgi:hypothetical protein